MQIYFHPFYFYLLLIFFLLDCNTRRAFCYIQCCRCMYGDKCERWYEFGKSWICRCSTWTSLFGYRPRSKWISSTGKDKVQIISACVMSMDEVFWTEKSISIILKSQLIQILLWKIKMLAFLLLWKVKMWKSIALKNQPSRFCWCVKSQNIEIYCSESSKFINTDVKGQNCILDFCRRLWCANFSNI